MSPFQLPDCHLSSFLTINDTGYTTISVDYSFGNPLPDILKLNGTFEIAGARSNDPLAGSRLELSRSSVVYFDYGSATSDPLAGVRSDLRTGYHQGAWNGTPTANTGAITLSATAADLARWTIAYIDSADGGGLDPFPGTVMLKPALIGDTNLDGTVNLTDLLTLSRNIGRGSEWYQGDFNFDATVDLADFLALSRNFGAPAPSPTMPQTVRRRR